MVSPISRWACRWPEEIGVLISCFASPPTQGPRLTTTGCETRTSGAGVASRNHSPQRLAGFRQADSCPRGGARTSGATLDNHTLHDVAGRLCDRHPPEYWELYSQVRDIAYARVRALPSHRGGRDDECFGARKRTRATGVGRSESARDRSWSSVGGCRAAVFT